MKKIIFGLVLISSSIAYSQDGYLELFRRDLKSDKLKLMIAAMDIPEPSSTAFWKIYKEYDQELAKLGDRIIANIKDYAAHQQDLSDEKTSELIENGFKNREDRMELLRKYYKRVKKELGVKVAARFVQAEMQILTLVDAQINDAVPLVRIPAR